MARWHSLLASRSALRGLQDSCGDDFAIHFRLTDVLKRLTNEVVWLVHGGNRLWTKGQVLEKLIGIGHDVSW
jgi:hypothetical protein